MDNEESHKKFIAKHNLNSPSLRIRKEHHRRFGARMAGRNLPRRVSFLIGWTVKIAMSRQSFRRVHLSEMKEAIAKLAKK